MRRFSVTTAMVREKIWMCARRIIPSEIHPAAGLPVTTEPIWEPARLNQHASNATQAAARITHRIATA